MARAIGINCDELDSKPALVNLLLRMSGLTVRIEEASPGDGESGGAGTNGEWGVAASPFGLCSIGWSGRRILHLAFCDQVSGLQDGLGKTWPNAVFLRNDQTAARWIQEIFSEKTPARIPVLVRGSAFQRKVWRAILRIPKGSVASYSAIASEIGSPGAYRAVGTACGANPVAWLIPCHRVLPLSGRVSGYRWGTERKLAMLAAEAYPL